MKFAMLYMIQQETEDANFFCFQNASKMVDWPPNNKQMHVATSSSEMATYKAYKMELTVPESVLKSE